MFYQSIAQVYDYIFPKNKKQLEFLKNIITFNSEDKILDIGCATGNLTELLSTVSKNVIGVDLDSELLSIARKKSNNEFKNLNMLLINKEFENESINKIISFGNTLVHLPSKEDVKNYFKAVYEVLKINGDFVVQIINYDRIINNNISNLPTINNDHVKFVRDYVYHKEKKYFEFITELTIKSTNQEIKNNIPLLALTQDEIKSILEDVGFKKITFYGGLNKQKLTDSSIPLLFSCKK